MNRVLYCDFQSPDPHDIGQEVRQFLRTLQNLTGWDVLEVHQNQVWLNDQCLGPAPAGGSWLDCLSCALETARPDLVFIWFNDLLTTRWSAEQVIALFAEAQVLMCGPGAIAQYIRVNPLPPPLGRAHGMHFRAIEAHESYQCSLPGSIWCKSYLTEMMVGHVGCWSLEIQAHRGLALSAHRLHLPTHNMVLRGRPNVIAFRWRNRPCVHNSRDWLHSVAWVLKSSVSKGLQRRFPRFYHWLYRKLWR